MKKSLFTGVCTALATPFRDGRINNEMLEQLLEFQIAAGIKAVVLAGTTGEAPTLSDEEKIHLIITVRKIAGDRLILIAGTGSNCTAHSISMSRQAQEAGADGLLVVSPYYNKTTSRGLIAHYSAIAEAVTLPIILYNVPSRTGVNMPVSVYQALSEIPNILGIKEASGNIRVISDIRNQCPEDFFIWSGNDDITVPIMAMGGQGVISVAANIIPKAMRTMTDAALLGDYRAAAAQQIALTPLIDALFSEVNPIPVKEALKQIGFDCGPCRLPLTDMDPGKRNDLQRILINAMKL